MSEKTIWKSVYKTVNSFEAQALLGHLQSEGITAVLVNKMDSALLTLVSGSVEIHVPEHEAEQALTIIQNSNI
jgi:Putative prokaryotic signal transducing protein